MKVLTLLTCYNRREKTKKAILGLIEGNPGIDFLFLVVDAGSTDGTREALKEFSNVTVIQGDPGLYYSNGMRLAMEQAKEQHNDFEYCLLINDDVEFYDRAVEKMTAKSAGNNVIVGPTCDRSGAISYGAVKYDRGIKYHTLDTKESESKADTFNANCVIIPWRIFVEADLIDSHYVHSLGDFDYGLMLRDRGYSIYTLDEYVGICENNPVDGTWEDPGLPFIKRIKDKESQKGVPFGQWFYFLRKNFGLTRAVWSSLTPYLRILMRR